jgi:hypothetical protein
MQYVVFHNEKLCCVAPPCHSTSWNADFIREIDASRSLASRLAKPRLAAARRMWTWRTDRVEATRGCHISPAGNAPRRYNFSGEKIVAQAKLACHAGANHFEEMP